MKRRFKDQPTRQATLHLLVWSVLFCTGFLGCGESGTPPATETFSVQGTLAIQNQGDNLTEAVVQLYSAPEDPLLLETLSAYPAVGFSPVEPMLYDPLTQTAKANTQPGSDGSFLFENLTEGTYLLDAELDSHACASPILFNLPGSSNVGTLTLTPWQPISGNVGESTWESGSVYVLTGNVLVLPEAKLTIEPDVLILVQDDYTLTVAGGMEIQGLPSHPVRFRLRPDHFITGGDWGGLRLDQPIFTCQISGTVLQHAATALRVIGGRAEVEECLMEASEAYGAYFSAGAEGWIRTSIVRDGEHGLVADNCAPEFSQNVMLRLSQKAITVKTNSEALIEGNAILQSELGVWSDWNTTPTIQNNLISGGSYGLRAQDGFYALVQYNQFIGQTQTCIALEVRNCYPIVQLNNFSEAPQTIFSVNGNNGQQADTVSAPNNYWDGESAAGIPLRIIDGFDIGSLSNPIGPVDYQPPRSTPISGAGP